jgi:WD40 repeat protein
MAWCGYVIHAMVCILAFSPDGALIATGSYGTILIWNVRTQQQIQKLSGHTDWVKTIAFSSDGTTIVSGSSDKTVRIWETTTGQHTHILTGNTSEVISVAISPDGATIVSGSSDKMIRLWKLGHGSRTKKALHDHQKSVTENIPVDQVSSEGSLPELDVLCNIDATVELVSSDTSSETKQVKRLSCPSLDLSDLTLD